MMSAAPPLAFLKTPEKTHALTNKVNIIGRAPTTHILVNHPSISKEHAAIDIASENEVILRDLNSLNACYVNGERLAKGASQKLNPGDQIVFGKEPTIFTFEKAGSRSPGLQQRAVGPVPDEVSQAVGLRNTVKDKKISVTDIVSKPTQDMDNPVNKALSRPIHEARSPNSIRSPLTPPNQQQQQQDIAENQPISAQRQGGQPPANQAQQVQMMASQQRELEEKMEHYEKRYQETYERVIELNSKILEKEEQLLRREGDLKYQTNEIDTLKDELEKQKAKLTALELYSTDLQRKLDHTQLEVTEKTRYIDEVANNDWVKKIHEMNSEIEALRAAIVQKEDELIGLKKQNNALIQGQKTANPAYHAAFLEQQGKELALAKRQLAEYENRASVCNKRWTVLIKENMDKEEVIKGLKLQLNRQLENYKALQKEFDSKINEMNMKFLSLIDSQTHQKQFEAGLFLVDQMKTIQEDRTNILLENENLHQQMQSFIEEINTLKSDNERYELLLGRNSDHLDLGDTSPSVLSKLKRRIEELEDYVEELKIKEGVPKVVEMMSMFENLEFEIAKLRREKDEFRAKLTNIQKGTSDDKSSIEFFSKLLQERDVTIAALKEHIASLGKRDRENTRELESFQRQLGNANNQIEGYQSKQKAFTEMFNTRKSFDVNPSNIIENEHMISHI